MIMFVMHYVMMPLLHTHQRRKQLGVVASYDICQWARRAPAPEHIWMPQYMLVRRWVHFAATSPYMWRGQVESAFSGIVSVFFLFFFDGFIELQDKHV
jgi:hypothetical protein